MTKRAPIGTGDDFYAGALDSYRYWMRCIRFADHATVPTDIIRWATYADESLNQMIAFSSR